MMIVIFSVRVVRGAAPASVRVRPTAKDDTAQTTARTKTVATEQMERTKRRSRLISNLSPIRESNGSKVAVVGGMKL